MNVLFISIILAILFNVIIRLVPEDIADFMVDTLIVFVVLLIIVALLLT